MLAALKQRMEEKKARAKAIAESRQWRTNPLLQDCLQAMRGSCTVAPPELHEAAIAAVNIALSEDLWQKTETIPGDFLPETVFLVWDDPKIPVLKALWVLVKDNLDQITAVAPKTFLVSENLDRIVRIDEQGIIKLYSVA